MPTKGNPIVYQSRGSAAYAKALDRLLKAVRKAGLSIESRHQLARYAVAHLAAEYGITMPPPEGPKGRPKKSAEKNLTPS